MPRDPKTRFSTLAHLEFRKIYIFHGVFLVWSACQTSPRNAMGGVESAAFVEDVVDVAIIGLGNPGKQGILATSQEFSPQNGGEK